MPPKRGDKKSENTQNESKSEELVPAGTTTNVSQVSASSETPANLSAQINPELGQNELETTNSNSSNMQIAEETSEDVT